MGYRFAGNVDSKGDIGRYTGLTPFSGIVRNDGDGATCGALLHYQWHDRLPILHSF